MAVNGNKIAGLFARRGLALWLLFLFRNPALASLDVIVCTVQGEGVPRRQRREKPRCIV